MADGRDFGKIINERRLELGYSLGQLANRMGTTASKVRSWERDQSVPDAKVISQLASELDLDSKTLMDALVKPKPKTKASPTAPPSGEATAAVMAPVFSDASHTAAAVADDVTPPPAEMSPKPKPDDKAVKAKPTPAVPKPAAVADKPSVDDTGSAARRKKKADPEPEADEPDALGSVPIVAASAGASAVVADKAAAEPAAAPPAGDPKAVDTAKAMDNAKSAAAAAAEEAAAAPKSADTAKAMDNAKSAAAAAAATAGTAPAASDKAGEPAPPDRSTAAGSKTQPPDAEPKEAAAAEGAKVATDNKDGDPKPEGDSVSKPEGDSSADAPTAVVVATAATAGAAVADADKSRLADIPTEAVPVVTAPTPEPSATGAVMAPPMVATSAPPTQPAPPAEPTGPFAPIERAARTIFDPDRKYLFWIRVALTLILFLIFFRVLIWAVPEFFDALNQIIDTIESTPTDTTSFIQSN